MGKQINYYLDYESFRRIAQKALELGCLIIRDDRPVTLPTPTDDLSAVMTDCYQYYFLCRKLPRSALSAIIWVNI